jgi:hypothetical protein
LFILYIDSYSKTVTISIGSFSRTLAGSEFKDRGLFFLFNGKEEGIKEKYKFYPEKGNIKLQGKRIDEAFVLPLSVGVTIGDWSCQTINTWKEKTTANGTKYVTP